LTAARAPLEEQLLDQLLDPRSEFYTKHPELPPLTIMCKLRVCKWLRDFAWNSVEECLIILNLHRKGAPLPPPGSLARSKMFAKMQVEMQLMRFIKAFASSENRIVAGSFPLHRLLLQNGADGEWKHGDIDLMTRGVAEADQAIDDTKAYWQALGYTVDARFPVTTEGSDYAFAGLEWVHERSQSREWHVQISRDELQDRISTWTHEKRDDPKYAPLMGELNKTAEALPAGPLARPWLIARRTRDNGVVYCSTIKITVTKPGRLGASHVINIIPYIKVRAKVKRPAAATAQYKALKAQAREEAITAPITSIVDSFDILACAVYIRMNANGNGYEFGGAGVAPIMASLNNGNPDLPLALTPCVFGRATDLPKSLAASIHTTDSEAMERAVRAAVCRQMERIAKYLERGFVFPL